MGAMGRYIAGLSVAARDRLISGRSWGPYLITDGKGTCCLRGHAEGAAASPLSQWELRKLRDSEGYVHPEWHDREAQRVHFEMFYPECKQILRFNEAIVRWPERTVRAIKIRAARLNGSSYQQIASMTEDSACRVGVVA